MYILVSQSILPQFDKIKYIHTRCNLYKSNAYWTKLYIYEFILLIKNELIILWVCKSHIECKIKNKLIELSMDWYRLKKLLYTELNKIIYWTYITIIELTFKIVPLLLIQPRLYNKFSHKIKQKQQHQCNKLWTTLIILNLIVIGLWIQLIHQTNDVLFLPFLVPACVDHDTLTSFLQNLGLDVRLDFFINS